MGDKPTDDPPQRADETAKLELPSLKLPRLRRARKSRTPEPVDEPPAPGAHARPTPVQRPAPEPEPAGRERAHANGTPDPQRTVTPPVRPASGPAPVPGDGPGQRRADRKPPSLPAVPGWVAALVAGFVVGAFGAGLTWVSLRGCEAVKGTESCGGTGLFLLVVIVVLMVLLGGLLLALLHVPEPRSTSFLGVGVLAVVVLVTLIQQLFSGWMFLVVPVLGAASYALAHRITTAFVEPVPERGPEHDVR